MAMYGPINLESSLRIRQARLATSCIGAGPEGWASVQNGRSHRDDIPCSEKVASTTGPDAIFSKDFFPGFGPFIFSDFFIDACDEMGGGRYGPSCDPTFGRCYLLQALSLAAALSSDAIYSAE